MARYSFLLLLVLVLGGMFLARDTSPSAADPGAVVYREPAYNLPHIYADTDDELAYAYGREIAKYRLGQIILLSRVGRGTLYQAFGGLQPGTFNDDVEVREEGYTSAELNQMFENLPAEIKDPLQAYIDGVNDVIEEVYTGTEPKPLEVALLQLLGLGDDLFGNATNISDQVDPNYLAPGGADPTRPNAGQQFTPELVVSIAILQVRNFGSEDFGEVSRLNELNSLLSKFPSTGDEIWEDLNFLNDPLAPVTVPDSTTPGFGGPLVAGESGGAGELPAYVSSLPGDFAVPEENTHREEFARSLGAWPAMGSYAWQIDGDLSDTGNPWVGGFPQTGIQTPSIMHFVETRSAEGSSNRIEARGMAFAGAPAILIGETDSVAWTSTTAQLKTADFFLEEIVLENADVLRYNDEGSPAPMSMRAEQIVATNGSTTPITVWRTHERAGNGGSRTVASFQGDASGLAEGTSTSTTLVDTGAFGGAFAGGYVAIVEGAGAGQIRPVLSATANTLTLDGGDAWTVTPNATSRYVAVESGNSMMAVAEDRAFWMEESTAALGFSLFQRAEDVLDIRAAARLIPSTHNFLSADNQSFNGFGTDLGSGTGNTGYYSSGFSRIRQGATDTRLPLDGTAANELVVEGGTVTSATANTLSDTGSFSGDDYSPPAVNFRLDNPSMQGSEYVVTIIAGDGARQSRRIASNDGNTLTLEADWGVAPSPGDLYEISEIVAMPEAINAPEGYTANWNNKAATADDGQLFGRQQRVIFILERLAADGDWTREEQRQLNKDVAGLDTKGAFGRYVIPRIRDAVDAVGNGGNPDVDTVLAALEAHFASPTFGRGFIDPVTATTIDGEVLFLESLINEIADAIYEDEFSGTNVGVGGGQGWLDRVQHAIDSAAADLTGEYAQVYTGDYFNSTDWRVVVRDAFDDTIVSLGGIPADIPRPNDTYAHPLSAVFPQLVFDPVGIGNRGIWEQIVEVGPTVLGEFIFPLGQSGFIDEDGNPDYHMTSLHQTWGEWRFLPMLHVAEDLAIDPDGDVDNDGVVDGFERWYFGSTSPGAKDDADSDGLSLLGEYQSGLDPTDADTDDDATPDPDENTDGDSCTNGQETGQNPVLGGTRNPISPWDFYDVLGFSGGPPDGVIDLANDILGVITHYSPVGYTPGDPALIGSGVFDDFDRGPAGADGWPTDPDGVIDLPNDILGVILQFSHSCV